MHRYIKESIVLLAFIYEGFNTNIHTDTHTHTYTFIVRGHISPKTSANRNVKKSEKAQRSFHGFVVCFRLYCWTFLFLETVGKHSNTKKSMYIKLKKSLHVTFQ